MKSILKLALIGALLSVAGTPLLAQIGNGIDFTTSFPFYAGNAKMPAGAYMITQSINMDESLVQIDSKDGSIQRISMSGRRPPRPRIGNQM